MKKIIEYSYDILYKIITGDIKEYIFKSPLKIAQEVIYLAKQKFNENLINDNESNIKKSNNNINNSCNRINRTSSMYHKISKYINSNNDKNNKNSYLNNNNNHIINNNTISTNSSSINKNNGYGGDTAHQYLNENNKEEVLKKHFVRINPDSNKKLFMEPLYSISSSKFTDNSIINNKKRNNSVITGNEYEIKVFQTTNDTNLNEESIKEKIKKKEIKNILNNNKEISSTSRYLINVNLAKRKHNKMQSSNEFSGIKLSLSNSKKSQVFSSFMRDNIKNMKSVIQFSNHHNRNHNKNK